MNRPHYESQKNRDDESEVIEIFAEAYDYDYQRQEDRRRANYFCYRGDTLCLIAEVKCRSTDKHEYPTVMIPLAKWNAGCRLSEKYGVPYALVISWADTIGALTNRMATYDRVGQGGRTDRGDPKDVERMVYFDVDKFRRLREV